VKVVDTGAAVLAAMRTAVFDIILLDIHMPEVGSVLVWGGTAVRLTFWLTEAAILTFGPTSLDAVLVGPEKSDQH
jgi:DNA-binding NarL/FixJ family response regulator